MTAVVLDAGALIGLERGDAKMTALMSVIVREEIPTYVPAGVVAQVWRGTPRQHNVGRLLATEAVRIDDMDEQVAKSVGTLLGSSNTSDAIDGHVALLGRITRGNVYTCDRADIIKIDPTLEIIEV